MINLSQHAQTRSQQRGVKSEFVDQIFEHADTEKRIGSNCILIRVSHKAAKTIRGGDKLSKFAVIWSESNAQVVTILSLNRGTAGRRYRSKN